MHKQSYPIFHEHDPFFMKTTHLRLTHTSQQVDHNQTVRENTKLLKNVFY